MQVMKFGGTSVANASNMLKVVDIVSTALERDRTILVSSAISKCTDTLIEIGRRASLRDDSYVSLIDDLQEKHLKIISTILPVGSREESAKLCISQFDSLRGITQGVYLLGELSPASLEAIESFGELLSTRIIAAKFATIGVSVKWMDSRKIVKTQFRNGKNVVDTAATYANMREMVDQNTNVNLFVVPGFIASDAKGRTTTLGRGGSDYTASLFAVGIKARLVEIWTDVPGIMTSNPKVVPTARTISNISYRAALELSHFGAKVIYPPTIQPVVSEGIPIYVKNTFDPSAFGTLIEKNPPRSVNSVTGISNSDNIALLSLEGSGMVGIPGFSSRLFDTLSRADINIILITQASSVHTMCIAVSEKDAKKAKEAADSCFAYEISLGKLNPLKVEKGWSIVCLVGDDVIGQSGATGRMLETLGRHGIQVRATAQGSSERNISVIVPSSCVDEAIRHIHNEFFDKSPEKDINLFIAGYGTVGKKLVEIIGADIEGIAARTGKRLRVCGISNSRKYVIDREGIDLQTVPALLDAGCNAADDAFFEELASLKLENRVFVDCTASAAISLKYTGLFNHGYSVVACNKIAFAAPYAQYRAMKAAAVASGVTLRYETTVGSALPMLQSVLRMVNSGSGIISVEAVLSGTLSYVFNTYKGGDDGATFADVVEQARLKGYTEPDPRLDLSGRDVLRKLLILSREAGIPLEEEDIDQSPMPDMEDEKAYRALYAQASAAGRKLRYMARLVKDDSAPKGWKASIELTSVGVDSPMYRLLGSDNSVVITNSETSSPLVIQGAGAGVAHTASGLLNDILL